MLCPWCGEPVVEHVSLDDALVCLDGIAAMFDDGLGPDLALVDSSEIIRLYFDTIDGPTYRRCFT